MDPNTPVPQTWFNIAVGAFIALLSAALALYRGKVDSLEKGHADIRENYVTRDDLDRHLTALAGARKEMHDENTRKLERIEDGLRRVHDRIDTIPYRTANARTRATDSR